VFGAGLGRGEAAGGLGEAGELGVESALDSIFTG
jgi:hypothetical protein